MFIYIYISNKQTNQRASRDHGDGTAGKQTVRPSEHQGCCQVTNEQLDPKTLLSRPSSLVLACHRHPKSVRAEKRCLWSGRVCFLPVTKPRLVVSVKKLFGAE